MSIVHQSRFLLQGRAYFSCRESAVLTFRVRVAQLLCVNLISPAFDLVLYPVTAAPGRMAERPLKHLDIEAVGRLVHDGHQIHSPCSGR